MSRPKLLLAVVLIALLACWVFLAACGPQSGPTSASGPTPATTAGTGPTTSISGEQLLSERCVACHSLDRVKSAHKTQAEWEQTVKRMVGKGARLNDAELALLVEYLAANYK